MFEKSVIILVVSREILEGSVVDRNAAFIANRIDDIGYRVRTIQVCDRVEAEMVATMTWALGQKPTFILVTGGNAGIGLALYRQLVVEEGCHVLGHMCGV